MSEKDRIIEIGPKEMEKVSGGSPDGKKTKIIRKCPHCGIKGPHTYYMGGKVSCDNCGHEYMT